MIVPLWVYCIVMIHVVFLGSALLIGAPLLDRFSEREDADGLTRVVKIGSMRYVEWIEEDKGSMSA